MNVSQNRIRVLLIYFEIIPSRIIGKVEDIHTFAPQQKEGMHPWRWGSLIIMKRGNSDTMAWFVFLRFST